MPLLICPKVRVVLRYLVAVVVESVVTIAYTTVPHTFRLQVVLERSGAHVDAAIGPFRDAVNDVFHPVIEGLPLFLIVWAVPHDVLSCGSFVLLPTVRVVAYVSLDMACMDKPVWGFDAPTDDCLE